MKKTNSNQPQCWISVLRIIATILIFIFHFQGLYGFQNKNIDLIGISLFCLISGFLAYPINSPTGTWFKKKYIQTMVPYWLIIIFVIIINYYVGYKHKQIYELVIIFFAGGMFVEKPLYVIAWYITFILSLYGMFALWSSGKNIYMKSFYLILSIAIYILIIKHPYQYALSFISGIILKKISLQKKTNSKKIQSNFNKILFLVQNRCYSFFLIHGGVLLFFVKVVPLSPVMCFILSFFLTTILTYCHYEISNSIIIKFTRN